MHLEFNIYPNEATLEKLISCSRVLEDLTIIRSLTDNLKVLQVRSETFAIIQFDGCGELLELVIDAPLLQFLRIKACSTGNFKIINLGLTPKVDIDVSFGVLDVLDPNDLSKRSMIHNLLTGISKVRGLVISHDTAKGLVHYCPRKKIKAEVMFPRVPLCLVSSLKFVELGNMFFGCEVEHTASKILAEEFNNPGKIVF